MQVMVYLKKNRETYVSWLNAICLSMKVPIRRFCCCVQISLAHEKFVLQNVGWFLSNAMHPAVNPIFILNKLRYSYFRWAHCLVKFRKFSCDPWQSSLRFKLIVNTKFYVHRTWTLIVGYLWIVYAHH